MENTINYDPNEYLSSPSPDWAYRVLGIADSPSFFDLNSINTQSGISTSQNSSNNSSPKSSIDVLGLGLIENEPIGFSSMTQPTDKLQIIAQPKALYRERYCSETDPSKHRAQRFIRADDEDANKHEYPTVQIPSKWLNSNLDLYIRVTLVTLFTENVPVICIHPYAIDTQESDVLRDSCNNSLYFPITKEEKLSGEKSFRISRKKMIQYDLRSYGSFRLFDSNQNDVQRVINIHDAKGIIETYQLWKSQLVFTVAERLNNNLLPIPIPHTSVTSQIMCDEASGRRKESLTNNTICTSIFDDDTIRCTPKKGDWTGGDEILMVIPKLDKRKVFNIYFDYGSMGRLGDIKASFVDSKTISFQTPPCPILVAEQNLRVPIVVTQNDLIIACVDFVYLTPNKTTTNLCSQCQFDMISNKRRYFILNQTESDGGESLNQQMSRLTTEDKSIQSNHRPANDDTSSKFDKYLLQLQEAVIEFVRTNNPSRLFRRTRLLIAKCDENPPPLDDAIRNGHINIALKLIEQAIDMSPPNRLLERENTDGETPLLLSAKLNHWILIEAILKKRLDLSEKTDKYNNNILHLLANISEEDKANETIENVLGLLPDDIKTKLLKQKNKDNQIPIEIAQIKNNTHCVDLFQKRISVF